MYTLLLSVYMRRSWNQVYQYDFKRVFFFSPQIPKWLPVERAAPSPFPDACLKDAVRQQHARAHTRTHPIFSSCIKALNHCSTPDSLFIKEIAEYLRFTGWPALSCI